MTTIPTINTATVTEILRDFIDWLEPQDEHRFYRVQNQDSLTIVAVSQVTLKPSGESHPDRSETAKSEHAELAAIRKISAWLDGRDLTEQTEISLTTMATSNPCLECQSATEDARGLEREA